MDELIYRQDAANILCDWCDICPKEERDIMHCDDVCPQFARIPSAQQWIPCSERLPEERINPNTRDFEYVLCVTIWGDVRPFKYGTPIGQKEAHFWNGAGYVDAYVTHWMPLPEPDKEDANETD